jgi:2-polyprenyl-3-methyl-5-hydroxy-6-metoxy-1,4-benzoquinol methylase
MTNATLTKRFDPPRTACDLCGSGAVAPYHKDFHGIQIARCAGCGAQFMNPAYADDYLRDYYAQYIVDQPEWEEPEMYCHHFYLSLAERFIEKPGQLLDIGTGTGYLLRAAKERGWIPMGYDVDPETVLKVSEKSGIKIFTGDFTKYDGEGTLFDMVTMHHALEHVKSPSAYLQVIHKILRPGGLLFIVVPNIRSISSLVKLGLEKAGLRRKKVGSYYDTPHHMWYFSPATIRKTFPKYGFKVLAMRSGHQVRPGQSKWKRFIMRNLTERLLWKSTFVIIAQKV